MSVNPVPYNPQFQIDFTPEGDTTELAIFKHIQEFLRLYALLYGLDVKKLDANDFKDFLNEYFPDGFLDIANKVAEDSITIDKLKLGNLALENAPLSIEKGGTGRTTAPSMLADLSSTTAVSPLDESPRPGVTGVLPVEHGGTGRTNINDFINDIGIQIPLPSQVTFFASGVGLCPGANRTFTASVPEAWVGREYSCLWSGEIGGGGCSWHFRIGDSTSESHFVPASNGGNGSLYVDNRRLTVGWSNSHQRVRVTGKVFILAPSISLRIWHAGASSCTTHWDQKLVPV